MSIYKNIQFIGYEISTAPKNAVFENAVIKSGEYVGIDNISEDIQQRCNLMMNAILTAENKRTVPEKDNETLKLFMSPEFFFRGPNGAYAMDDLQKIISLLQDMIKDEVWKDWMFVFGSSIGSSIPDQSDWLIQFDEAKLFREVYNVVLVQQGGFGLDSALKENTARIIMKEFMSGIDFILTPTQGINLTQSEHLVPFPPGTGKEEQLHNYDGLGIFTLNDIFYGLEICLDHLSGRLKGSPQLPGSDMVAFQLIPSCGMDIMPNNVVAQNEGYCFNVDGRTNPSSSLRKITNNLVSPLPVASTSFAVPVSATTSPFTNIEVDKIFANGGGAVKIYTTIEIPPPEKVPGSSQQFDNKFFYNFYTTNNDKYIFHFLIEYDENKNYRASYIAVTLKEYKYNIDSVLLPVKGDLFNGALSLEAYLVKSPLLKGGDCGIYIKFRCVYDNIEGIFTTFNSYIG